MNGVTTFSASQLPDTIEDLTQFVLVGKAKLQAYMLKLQTVNKLSTAQEIRDQTLKEAQEVSTALIAAEQRIGELLLAIPKQTGNQYTSANSVRTEKAKSEVITEMGYDRHEASDYQRMAKNPEVVQKVIEDALANGDVVTKSQVMKEIKALKDQMADRDRKIRDLESREPETRIVEKTVEVVPDDYREAKEMYEIRDKDFKSLRKLYDEMAEKWKTSENEKRQIRETFEKEKETLLKQAEDPIEKEKRRLSVDAFSLCAGISNFLEQYGGYVYLTHELENMSKLEREGIQRGLSALYNWTNEMLNAGIAEVI